MYEAYDTISNTNVVLKETVGNMGKVTTSSQMEAINSEFLGRAKTLTEIKHGSLVSVQDYFADIDRQYLVLEPVTGVDLSKFLLPDEQRPALADVLSWADHLLDALQFLHTRQTPIIHGDIRPENVKLTSDSNVKLLTAHAYTDGASDIITHAPTQSSDSSGVHYRPLEQLWDGLDALSQRVILNHYDDASERWLLQPLSPATDLYSLGATLYGVLTGSIPADALDRSIAALEGKPDPLPNPSELDSAIPPEISDVIMKAMSLRREDRFYSAVILRQILRTAAFRVKERQANDLEIPAPGHLEPPTETYLDATLSAVSPTEQSGTSTDERRREIETEQQRLEIEREQLEKRRLELDAEMELQKAEQARIEFEVEAANQKIEDERQEDEARQACELAAKILADKVTDIEAPLLELEPFGTPPEKTTESSETLDVPESLAGRSYLDTEPDEPNLDFVLSGFEEQADGLSNRRAPLMVRVAVVLLIVAIIGVWKFTSSESPSVSSSAAALQLNAPAQTEIQTPTDDDRDLTQPAQSVIAEPLLPTSSPETIETATHDKVISKAIPQTIAQEKIKKQAVPAPVKAPAAKKAVTVDDLINDH